MKKLSLLFLLMGIASAQVFEAGFNGGVNRISSRDIGTFGGTAFSFDNGWKFGARMTINNARFIGYEIGYGYHRTKLTQTPPGLGTGMAIHTVPFNFLIYGTPEGSPVRPFITGGGHFCNFVPPGASVSQGGGDLKFGYNYGTGVKSRVRANWIFRLDLRYYMTGKPFDLPGATGKLKQLEISAGVSWVM